MPAGLGPFGLGTPPDPGESPTGTAGSRFINPATRDYEVDAATSQFKQMPTVRQRVMLAIATELDSSGVAGFGKKRPRKMGSSFESEERALVSAALRQMIEVEKVVRLDGVTVERGSLGRARTTISFTDLTTGEKFNETV